MTWWKTLLLMILFELFMDQFFHWSERLSNWIIRQAALMLPPNLQARMQEEWLAHAESISGRLGRLWFAVGTLWASCRIDHEVRLPEVPLWEMAVKRIIDIYIAAGSIALLIPCLPLSILWLCTTKRPKVMQRENYLGREGKEFTRWTVCIPDKTKGDQEFTPWGFVFLAGPLHAFMSFYIVLRGDASIIGPRAKRARRSHLVIKEENEVLKMKPGVGFPILLLNDGAENQEAELSYVKNYSLLLDLKIILQGEIFACRFLWRQMRKRLPL